MSMTTRFTDQSNWMENLSEEAVNVPLKALAIPGSNKCGSFELNTSLPVAPDQSSVVKSVVRNICYAKDLLARWKRTQNLNISTQLKHGVRYFDIRVAYLHTEDDFFFVNGLHGPRLSQVLGQINSFLNFHPKEVVIMNFGSYCEFTKNLHIRFCNLLNSMFQGKFFAQSNGINSSISTIWNQGKQAIVIYDKDVIKETLYEFWADDCVFSPSPDTSDLKTLKFLLDQRFNNLKANRFNVLQAILTPNMGTVFAGISSSHEVSLVEEANEMINEWLVDTYNEHKTGMTIVLLDFIEQNNCISNILKFNNSSG